MNREQRAQIDALDTSGYLSTLRELAMSLTAPFFWSGVDDTGHVKVLHNGTVCYVDTGTKTLGITANHVYQQYLDDFANYDQVECQFGGSTIVPDDRILDRHSDLDLATFDIPEVFVTAGHKSIHHPTQWPPPRVTDREVVLYGGYPGILREEHPGQMDFKFQSFAWALSDVTGHNMQMHLDFANLHWPGHEHDRINENPGGISGGPVFRVVEGAQIGYMELVGFIYDYLAPWEVMRARHADRVLANGTLVAL